MEEERDRPSEGRDPQDETAGEKDWFFDLPGDASNKAEATQRELRGHVEENFEESRKKRDAFRPMPPELISERDERKKGGLFGRRKKSEPTEERRDWQSPGGTWTLNKDAVSAEQRQPTDPPPPQPNAIRRALQEPGQVQTEPEQEWSTESFADFDGEAKAEAPAEPVVERKTTRWEEMFGAADAPALQDHGAVEGMKAMWGTSASKQRRLSDPASPPASPAEQQESVAGEVEAFADTAFTETVEEEFPAPAVTEQPSAYAHDEEFVAEEDEEDGYAPEPVAEYASEPVAEFVSEPVSAFVSEPVAEYASEPVAEFASEPVAEFASEPVAEYAPEPVAEYASEPVAEFASEPAAEFASEPVAEPVEETAEEAPLSKWDEMFSRSAEEDSIEAMRRWSASRGDTQATRRVLPEHAKDISEIDPDYEPSVDEFTRDIELPEPEERKGLFGKVGRLFRRKTDQEELRMEYVAKVDGDWLPPETDDRDEAPRSLFAAEPPPAFEQATDEFEQGEDGKDEDGLMPESQFHTSRRWQDEILAEKRASMEADGPQAPPISREDELHNQARAALIATGLDIPTAGAHASADAPGESWESDSTDGDDDGWDPVDEIEAEVPAVAFERVPEDTEDDAGGDEWAPEAFATTASTAASTVEEASPTSGEPALVENFFAQDPEADPVSDDLWGPAGEDTREAPVVDDFYSLVEESLEQMTERTEAQSLPVPETRAFGPVDEAPAFVPADETPAFVPADETPALLPDDEPPAFVPVDETPAFVPAAEPTFAQSVESPPVETDARADDFAAAFEAALAPQGGDDAAPPPVLPDMWGHRASDDEPGAIEALPADPWAGFSSSRSEAAAEVEPQISEPATAEESGDAPWAAFVHDHVASIPDEPAAEEWGSASNEPAFAAEGGEEEPDHEAENPWSASPFVAADQAEQAFDESHSGAAVEEVEAPEELDEWDGALTSAVETTEPEPDSDFAPTSTFSEATGDDAETPAAEDPSFHTVLGIIDEVAGEPGDSSALLRTPGAHRRPLSERYQDHIGSQPSGEAPARRPDDDDGEAPPEEETEHPDLGGWKLPSGSGVPADDEMDLVLRAFEAHAATPDHAGGLPPGTSMEADAAAFDGIEELLGDAIEDLADGERDADAASRPFNSLKGWAPQRSPSAIVGAAAWDSHAIAPTLDTPGAPAGAWPNPETGEDDSGSGTPPWTDEATFDGERNGSRGSSRAKTLVREIVETGLLALLVFLAVRGSFQNFRVEGQSMEPTLADGEFLIVNKLVYSEVNWDSLAKFIPFIDAEAGETKQVFHGPERGDVIVFRDPRNPDEDLIKRVIGLPGETVEIRNGVVYVNSQPLEEPYLERAWEGNKEARVIPADEFFVLGDNRSNSLDSRSDQIGLVHKDLIIGKATLAYWPSDKFASSLSETPTCSPNPNCSATTDGSEIASSGR